MSESSSPPSQLRTRQRRPLVSKSRTMSPTRLKRKRETDRESQRAVRERTRKYISRLENLVETLRKDQPDERLQDMTRQNKRLHEENEQLRSILTGISRMVRDVEVPKIASNIPIAIPHNSMSVDDREQVDALDTNGSSRMTCPLLQNEKVLEQHSPFFAEQQLARSLVAAVDQGLSFTQNCQVPENDMFCHRPETEPPRSDTLPTSQVTDPPEEISLDRNSDVQLFAVVNNALSKAQTFAITSIEPERDADIAIRAVRYGWHAAEQSHSLDQAWQLLRQIDQSIFFCCGPVERLAILRILRLKLQHAADSSQQQIQSLLPPFLSPRPLQKSVKHLSLIDYFVWPELRELLILKSGTYISNRGAAIFASSIRFLWAFDLSDIWTRNIHTGLYSFSNLFDERFKDIRSWMMSSQFFDLCPELVGYIQIYDPAPGRALVPDCGIDARRKAENNSKDHSGVGVYFDLENRLNCNNLLREGGAEILPI